MKIFIFLPIIGYIFTGSCFGNTKINSAPFVDTAASLSKYPGKVVKFTATFSTVAEQHPTGLLDKYDPKTGELLKHQETYVVINAGEPQIVLVSSNPITCAAAIEKIDVEGTVTLIRFNGKPGTKTAYARPWVKVAHYKCH